MGVTLAAAGSYQWFRDALGSHELARQEAEGIDAYRLLDEEAKAVAPGSEGLIYLPYLTGERCPLNDPNAKGGFIGVTSLHRKGHFARAVLEGVAFSLRQVYELIMSVNSGTPTEIIVSGGGAKSPLWRQILADIFQLPVHTVYGSAEGGAFGAALVAGTGCGLWDSMEEAMELARPDSEILPRAEYKELYGELFLKYTKLYGSLKWFFDEIQ